MGYSPMGFLKLGDFIDAKYLLGPKPGEMLLVTRDIFNTLETEEISQTEVPGILQIITQDIPMPVNKDNAAYLIHMQSYSMPKDMLWKTFDLKTYNRLRAEKFR
jgi:hypothetical protein